MIAALALTDDEKPMLCAVCYHALEAGNFEVG